MKTNSNENKETYIFNQQTLCIIDTRYYLCPNDHVFEQVLEPKCNSNQLSR